MFFYFQNHYTAVFLTIQYITEIAEYNGWSADMDMTNPLVNKLMNVIILLFLLNELRLFIILFVNVCLYAVSYNTSDAADE